MEAFLKIIKRLMLGGDLKGSSSGRSRKLTNPQLVKAVKRAFEQEIADRSMEEMMYFPLCIYIDLHNDDYLEMRPYFPHIVVGLIRTLPEIIARKQRNYKYCEPAANYWHFEFRTAEHITTMLKKSEPLVGMPVIQTLPVGTRTQSENSAAGTGDAGKTSRGKAFSISNEMLIESGMWDDGRTFTPPYIPFAPSVAPLTTPKKEVSSPSPCFAVLQEGDNQFEMKETKMEITGSSDTRKLPNTVWHLNVKLGTNPYISIEYKEKDRCFVIAAYGEITLNGSSINISKGGEIKRYKLPASSTITIPTPERAVRISFKSNL
jgi:hypothetical protein